MDVIFERKTFVIIGRLQSMTKDEAWSRIEKAGGYTSKTPRPSSDYIIVAHKPPNNKLYRARQVGKPQLTEEEFLAALELVEKQFEESREELAFSEVIPNLRAIMSEEPGDKTWFKITDLLDNCETSQLELPVDYVEQHIKTWPNPAVGLHAPLPFRAEGVAQDVRKAPDAWLSALLTGERSPKFRLIHSIDLSYKSINGNVASKVTNHPDLTNVRELNVGYENKLSGKFHKQLIQSTHLPQLDTLSLHIMSNAIVKALCKEHHLTGLRYITLASPEFYGEEKEYLGLYNALFQADWWSQIEGLSLCISRGNSTCHTATAYQALAESLPRLPNLKHLDIHDNSRITSLCQSGIFHQLERLSLGNLNVGIGNKVLHYLKDHPDHSVQILDLSRCVFFLGYSGSSRLWKNDNHNKWLETLLSYQDPGALRELVLCEDHLTPRLREQLDEWASEHEIAITFAPWARKKRK